jgi:acetoin:2,6-dichlorophenolindophenol oxidoreductase subunit beta
MATKNYADAMLDVLETFMEEDPLFAVMGNEVLGIGPEAGQFEPFQKKYADRIYFPPCSEAAFTALAAGAAMCGQRIFAHLGLAPFTYPAFSSIASEIAPARQSSGGKVAVPVTIHMSHGLLHGGAAQHSESPLGMYWNLPGIEITTPWTPADLKGLLRTAIKSDNPTIVVTHAFGYGAEGEVPDGDYEIPFGQAEVRREGSDVTLVSYSMMVASALEAAETLAGEGIEAEVIDPRTLVPLDLATIVASVERTNRLVVAHEAVRHGGFGAEIAAQAQLAAFDFLDAPIERVGAPFHPVPFSPPLEDAYLPGRDDVYAAARATLGLPVADALPPELVARAERRQ